MLRRSLVVLWLVGLALAEPMPKKIAMVLKAEGNSSALTGQMWAAGDRVNLPAGAKVTVLLLNKGERIEITGAGTVVVARGGLNLLEGARSKKLSTTQVSLALTGENHRQVGGMTVRNDKLPPPAPKYNLELDRVEVSEAGVLVSRPAGSGAPPRLRFLYLDPEGMPNLTADFNALARSPVPEKSVFTTQVAGRAEGNRWFWQAPWPLEESPRSYSLRVFPVPSGPLQLWTRLYHPSVGETKALAAARQQVKKWVQREPASAEPWVYLANLLEEKGQLEEALKALDSALALQPGDKGLLEMKARLLMDLGRYLQAYKVKPKT